MSSDSPPSVEPFRRVSIRGLLNQGDFELEFGNGNISQAQDDERVRFDTDGTDFDSLRIVYGLNGSGKTSALSIINALLLGDIPKLLSIPFQSIEVERWEPWGADAEKIPGGVDGMQIATTDSGDGTFSENYNYLKFFTIPFPKFVDEFLYSSFISIFSTSYYRYFHSHFFFVF